MEGLIIINAPVASGEIIETGDVVYFTSNGLKKTSTGANKWGIVVDEDNKAVNRLVAVGGIFKIPKVASGWYIGSVATLDTSTGKMVDSRSTIDVANGMYVGNDLFYIYDNTIYSI